MEKFLVILVIAQLAAMLGMVVLVFLQWRGEAARVRKLVEVVLLSTHAKDSLQLVEALNHKERHAEAMRQQKEMFNTDLRTYRKNVQTTDGKTADVLVDESGRTYEVL